MKKIDILIEGTNWNIEGVLKTDSSEQSFVSRHINDEGTYNQFNGDIDKKTSTLKLAWKLINEDTKPKVEEKEEKE